MNEKLLHDMAAEIGGRFKLTVMVQKRLVELMQQHSDVIAKNCGGKPIRMVVEEIARKMELLPPEAPEMIAGTETVLPKVEEPEPAAS